MKIYTKQGDSGSTQVYAKEVLRLDKDDAILECYGTLDELNAWIGYCASCLHADAALFAALPEQHEYLIEVQQQLFAIGFGISDVDSEKALSGEQAVASLESNIDTMQSKLAPQTSFILPGGHPVASQIHIARTVARRSERCLVTLSKSHEVSALSMAYINRLSDYLFTLARMINQSVGQADIKV